MSPAPLPPAPTPDVGRILALAAHRSDDAVILCGPDEQVLLWSRGAERMFGWSAGQAVGRAARETYAANVPAVDFTRHAARLREAPKRRQRVQRVHRSGRLLEIDLSSVPVHDDHGRLVGTLGVLRDVSSQRRAATALAASEQRYRAIFEFATDGIILLDREFRFLDANPFACRLFGYTRAELLGTGFFEHIEPRSLERLPPRAQELRRRGELTVQRTVLTRDGSEVEVEMRASVLADGRIQGILRDVTARVRAETAMHARAAGLEAEVRERTADMEALSYSVSHDLRAPLHAISGFAELMRESATVQGDAEVSELVSRAAETAARMYAMMDALLESYRAGRVELHPAWVDTTALVDSVIRELEFDGQQGRVVRRGSLPQAYGDPVLLRLVWQNLVGNALKFSRAAAAPRVELSGEIDEGGVSFRVRDNGVGFDPAHADRLFRVFSRLHPAEQYEGTGAGLAIVQRIVARHGGQVTAEGRPGAGATFGFSLPFPDADAAAFRHAQLAWTGASNVAMVAGDNAIGEASLP